MANFDDYKIGPPGDPRTQEVWKGSQTYSGRKIYTDEFIDEHPEFHAATFLHWDKRALALAIGERMIADGCVKVESSYDIQGMQHTFVWVARPFKKGSYLP